MCAHSCLGNREEIGLTTLLNATVASVLWLPDCEVFASDTFLNWLVVYQQTPLTASSVFIEEVRSMGASRHDEAAIVSRLSAMCICAFHCCWRHLLKLFCSDRLITSMTQAVLPSVHSPWVHIRRRTLHLISMILTDLTGELNAVTKLGSGISMVGQLLGHLVCRSGDQADASSQLRAGDLLVQLLGVQRELPTYPRTLTGVTFGNGPEVTGSTSSSWMADFTVLSNLVISLPTDQLFSLVQLIFNGITHYFAQPVGHNVQTKKEGQTAGSSKADATPAGVVDNQVEDTLSCSAPKTILCSRLRSLNMPPGELSRLLTLFTIVVCHRAADLNETQTTFILEAAAGALARLTNRALRAALLVGISELGHCWPTVGLQAVISNSLPLDLHWSVMLAAMAFLPVQMGQKRAPYSIDGPESVVDPLKTVDEVARLNDAPENRHLYNLLTHSLSRLDYTVACEKRDIPVEVYTSKRRQSGGGGTGSSHSNPTSYSIGETHFATHAWLSLINGLQILSLPLTVTELVEYQSVPEGGVLSAYRFLAKSGSTGENTHMFDHVAHPDLFRASYGCHELKALWYPGDTRSVFADRRLFCRLLGQWILALSVAAICRTPTGKSYETRSGAEAMLALNVSPISIVDEGLKCFLTVSGLHSAVSNGSFNDDPVTKVDADQRNESVQNDGPINGGPPTVQECVNLRDSRTLLSYIMNITRSLAGQRSPDHLLQLVHFFTHQLTSANEMTRLVAVTVVCSALSYQCLPVLSAQTTEFSSSGQPFDSPLFAEATPDTFLEHLLNQLTDSSFAVRHSVVVGLGQLVPSPCPDADDDFDMFHKPSERTSPPWVTSFPQVSLVRRHATAIIGSLVRVTDVEEDRDGCALLLAALRSLTRLILCFRESQLRPLLSSLCQRLLSIYIHPSGEIRAAAFRLFGRLVTFAWDDNRVPHIGDTTGLGITASYDTLFSEAETVYVSLVLHLNDKSNSVVNACKTTLLTVAALLFVPEVKGVVELENLENPTFSPPHETHRLLNFLHNCVNPRINLHHGEFYSELAHLMITCIPDKVSDYTMRCTVFFRSDWSRIQCNAVLFAGSLLGQFTEPMRANFPRSQITEEFVQMLRSGKPELRTMVAHAISRLHWF